MPNKIKRIVLAGGGTGGHLYPLVAVARKMKQEMKERGDGVEIRFIGPDHLAREIFAQEDITVRTLSAGKLRRYFSFAYILDILKAPVGFLQAYWHLFWFMPDLIFAKGGYGSVPTVFVGWLFRIPIVMHESDTVPGLANRFLHFFAKHVVLAFPDEYNKFPKHKTSVLGNPVRGELFGGNPEEARKNFGITTQRPVILVLGGSQGARQINELLFTILPTFTEKYEVIHQVGEKNFPEYQKSVFVLLDEEHRKYYYFAPFFNEQQMRDAYAICDIIISRAGAGGIFEIAAARKASILVPLATSANDHQNKNAQIYAKTGAAVVLEGQNLTPHLLEGEVDAVARDQERRNRMAAAAKEFARPSATQDIAKLLIKVVYPGK